MLGISRTPVKEAFHRLGIEGLIMIYPHRGTFVNAPLEPKEVGELFAVRLMIELWAAGVAINDSSYLDLHKMEEILRECDGLFSPQDAFDYMAFFKLDHAFHSVIVAAAGVSRLSTMYESLAVHIQILRSYWGQPRDRALKAHEDHYLIFESLRDRSRDILDILRSHIENSKTLALALGASK
jgi:DNA-binding GntR family transcriptional regulator